MANEFIAELLRLRDDETLTIRKASSDYGSGLELTRRRKVGEQMYAAQVAIEAIKLNFARCPDDMLAYLLRHANDQITKMVEAETQAKGAQAADIPLRVDRP